MTSNATESDLQEIEERTIRLKADPEYVVQSVPILAKFGDGSALLNISKSFYDYNPTSIQAIRIRAQVEKVVISLESSCPNQVKLIENTPWQQDVVENYLDCLKLGRKPKDLQKHLTLVKQYLNFSYPAIDSLDLTFEYIVARATAARIEFELGNTTRANSIKRAVIKEVQVFQISNSDVDFAKVNSRLNF